VGDKERPDRIVEAMLSCIVITCTLLGIIGSGAVVSRQDALVG